ncbi:MAG: DNA-processing protein DprA [Persicimonas sp.]
MNIEARQEKLRGFGELERRELAARWTLWRVDGVGYRRMARLVDHTGGELAGLFETEQQACADLLEEAGITGKSAVRIIEPLGGTDPRAAFERELESLPPATTLHHLGAPGYPKRLLVLEAPPVFVYVRGKLNWLPHVPTLAVVGSRRATVAQTRRARRIAADLAGRNVAVVSGGARGIDASAHRGCLDGEMPTVAVLASGVDRPTPRQNAPLFDDVIERGAIVSEYPLGVEPRRYHYHRRNDLIAALGDATLVVRAGKKSGTLITAESARKLKRPLCVLPGGFDEPNIEGCLKLLVEGAQCVRGADDVVERVLGRPAPCRTSNQMDLMAEVESAPAPEASETSTGSSHKKRPVGVDVSEDGKAVLEALDAAESAGAGPDVHRDELERRLDWPSGRLDRALLELELAGLVTKRAGANAFRR